MTKQEAIEAMKSGAKVTHRFFTPEEFIIMEDDFTIGTEEGYAFSTAEFWRYRKKAEWQKDWSIWVKPETT